MTQEQIIEGNKLIAEFMGARIIKSNDSILPIAYFAKSQDIGQRYTAYELNFLNYDASWDWLMPVVKKCKETDPISYPHFYFKHALDTLRIELVWQAVVNYIEWYNQNK